MSLNEAVEDDITVENDTSTTEMTQLKDSVFKKKETSKKEEDKEISEEEMKKLIGSYDPPAIKDWPKIPYKTIFIVLLLFSSSILFMYNAVKKFREGEAWTSYFSYGLLGGLLFIPGGFYSFILVNILLGREGYEYDILPDLSDN